MFSLPSGESGWGSNYGKVAQAIDSAMDNPTRSSKRKWDAFRVQLTADQKKFNLFKQGTNKYTKRAFGRAQSTAGAMALFQGFVHFDPKKRTTDLGQVLQSDFFGELT